LTGGEKAATDVCGRIEEGMGKMTERSRKRNTDAGFSLIELIVVVIIMGVLATTSIIGISQVLRTNVSTAAEKLAVAYDRAHYDNFYLDGDVILKLEYADGRYYAVVFQEVEVNGIPEQRELSREEIADNRVTVTAVTSGGTETDVALSPVTIAFYKSSGAMKATEAIYSGIRLQNAARKAELVLVEHTGRCFTDTAPDW